MSDASGYDPDKEKIKEDHSPSDDDLLELRSLLQGQMQSQLKQLQMRLDNPKLHAKDISQILPEAIVIRASKDTKIKTALASTVDEIIKDSVKKDPKSLGDILFPVMGPAIRKSISDMIRRMIQSLNQTLEQSFSRQGFKWRLEALRAGKPFAEVVLLHTLLYRVEQVFLIHNKTGLMLQHVVAESVKTQDADMVSGMLTAIQDFVKESFKTKREESLETIQVGELTIWIEQGPQAILAAVIRGNAPEEFRLVLQDTLENIHLEQNDALESFEGDTSSFAVIRHYLDNCLPAQYHSPKRKSSPLLWVLFGTIIIALGCWGYFSVRDYLRWSDYLCKLRRQPGIVITNTEKLSGKYVIFGLRDPLAANPIDILKKTKLNPKDVEGVWEPYQALNQEFILKRAKKILNPPETVSLKLKGDILIAEGSASHQWITEAQKMACAIPGIMIFQKDNIIDQEVKTLLSIKKRLNSRIVLFLVDRESIAPNQDEKLQDIVNDIRGLQYFSQLVGKDFHIEIIGHADTSGTEMRNIKLSQTRADRLYSVLVSKGISPINLNIRGAGSKEPLREEVTDRDKALNRSVTFKVTLTAVPEKSNKP